jgi:hypothetical protein
MSAFVRRRLPCLPRRRVPASAAEHRVWLSNRPRPNEALFAFRIIIGCCDCLQEFDFTGQFWWKIEIGSTPRTSVPL